MRSCCATRGPLGLIGTRSNIPAGLYTYYDGIVGSLIDAGFSYRIAHRALHAFGSLPLGFAQGGLSPTSAGGSLEAETAEAEFATIAEALPHLTAMMSAEAHDVADPTLAGATARPSSSSPSTCSSTGSNASAEPAGPRTPRVPELVRRRVESSAVGHSAGQRDRVSGGRCGRRRRARR